MMRVFKCSSATKCLGWIVAFFALLIGAESALAALPCGDLANALGPLDYTNAKDHKTLMTVEAYHFTPETLGLLKPGYNILDDIAYTLRVFPNHHQALYTIVRYEIRERRKSQKKREIYNPPMTEHGYPASAECYLDRAIRWRPNDPTVRLIHGLYLHLIGDLQKALAEYKLSEQMQPNSADLQYNLGLLYFDLKQYALAKEHARKAYQLGYPLPGLRKKLVSLGQWP